ncbi:MAG: 3-hydroxyacyl-CoA dehydrogenase family protein [Syntrophomonadaceae bacterium]
MQNDWNITVVGAGTMGHSIAQVFAVNGFCTTLVDNNPEQLRKAEQSIKNNLDTLLEAGEITEEQANLAPSLIKYSEDLNSAAESNYIVETVFENPEIKRDIFSKLDAVSSPDAIFTSNTSAMNVFEIADVSNPERLVIAHWFNPPHLIPLVEIVKGPQTSEKTVETVKMLMVQLGKRPAVINQYIPGFIVNRISATIAREAGYIIAQGWATPEDIDAAIVQTYGPRFAFEGPLELRDYLGWDISTKVSAFLLPHLCSNSDPVPLIVDLCNKGWYGVKAGRGLKDYSQTNISQLQKERTQKILKMLKAIKEL